MVARCACVLLVKLQSRDSLSETDIVQTLQQTWGRAYTAEALIRETRSMLVMGSYYRNIEQELGPGSYLLLGKDFAESR